MLCAAACLEPRSAEAFSLRDAPQPRGSMACWMVKGIFTTPRKPDFGQADPNRKEIPTAARELHRSCGSDQC